MRGNSRCHGEEDGPTFPDDDLLHSSVDPRAVGKQNASLSGVLFHNVADHGRRCVTMNGLRRSREDQNLNDGKSNNRLQRTLLDEQLCGSQVYEAL